MCSDCEEARAHPQPVWRLTGGSGSGIVAELHPNEEVIEGQNTRGKVGSGLQLGNVIRKNVTEEGRISWGKASVRPCF